MDAGSAVAPPYSESREVAPERESESFNRLLTDDRNYHPFFTADVAEEEIVASEAWEWSRESLEISVADGAVPLPRMAGPVFRSEFRIVGPLPAGVSKRSDSVGSPSFGSDNGKPPRITSGSAVADVRKRFLAWVGHRRDSFRTAMNALLGAITPFFSAVSGAFITAILFPVRLFRQSLSFVFMAISAAKETILALFSAFRSGVSAMVSSGRFVRGMAAASLVLLVSVGGNWGVRQFASVKGRVLGESVEGISIASDAVNSLAAADFLESSERFAEAYRSFSDASDSLGTVGNELAKAARFVPGLSMVSSGQGLLEGAKYLSAAGASMSGILKLLPSSADTSGDGNDSFLKMIATAEIRSAAAEEEIAAAMEAFDRVRPEDVPEEHREAFVSIREKLPMIADALHGFNRNSHLVRELLGENGPRLYLFLFQNNAELRPTGGFIGSYGLLEVTGGHVRKFFVDGIFNPDGQLRENIVPPEPIQKVSTGWSLHDSNWWPDFPTSAEKAIFFYEKTGGPTVDGVVTLTPTVIRDALRLTGPIDMPEYGVTIDAENFLEVVQEEVEENYDRELNQPKKILADLAPIMLDRLFSLRSAEGLLALSGTLSKALDGKHVLLYSRNAEIEGLIDAAGWSGRMLDTPRDYLSVVHTNINGYKTDAVITEDVSHSAAVQADGSVLDTVRITRNHTGGDTPYDWFNRVNADYLRVYVPKGSELVSVSGQTYEFPKPPVDYDALGFRRDGDVERDERTARIEKSGTRVSEESGKTVFGNWVYVSPGEHVTVEYVYRLPFRVAPEPDVPATYSILFQKQSGTEGVALRSELTFSDRFRTDWRSDGTEPIKGGLSFRSTLDSDEYYGTVFSVQ